MNDKSEITTKKTKKYKNVFLFVSSVPALRPLW